MINKIKQHGWRKIYGWSMKMWGSGYGILVAKFYGILNLIIVISTYFVVKGFELSFSQTIMIGVIGIIVIFGSGILFVKIGLIKAEAESNFKEQPQQYEMYQRIQRIEQKLDKFLDKEESE